MIGTKFYKDNLDDTAYADAAIWCNSNNAHIEDKGEYYEVVVNPEPTEAEKNANKVNEAHQYLDSTDWIDNKLFELMIKDKDTYQEYLNKYADVLTKREEARLLINEFENK